MSDDLLKQIVATVIDKLDVDKNKVTEDAKFIDDLGADSLDTVELIMQFEEDFDIDLPRKVTRPWGTYDSLDESGTFKVKKLVVNPGEKLSLQFHKKRSETWIVVKGKATVEIDNVLTPANS